jgi:hypothetical protein
MKHLVLLGDSIFDNKIYVKGGLDVIAHLRRQIPQEWKADLLAVDGSVVKNVSGQILDLPEGATHLVISAGGNDALLSADILQQKAESSAEVLAMLADVAVRFETDYRKMLQTVLRLKLPTALCSIYYPRIPEPLTQKIAVAGLTIFNDVIIKQAFIAGLPLIDLRLVCSGDSDYANEIEPGEKGGEKIAKAIVRLISEHNFASRRTEVFV